jgi:hypothetical protein
VRRFAMTCCRRCWIGFQVRTNLVRPGRLELPT